jgi:DNA topoisomerase VI subunit A
MQSNLSQQLLQLLARLFEALNGGQRAEFFGILVDRHSIRHEQTARQVAILLRVIETVLNQITSQTTCTKRDIYYMNTRLFQSQSSVNAALLQIQSHLNVPQQALNIRSSGKGLVYGHLQILHCKSSIDTLVGKETLIPSMECITEVKVSETAQTIVIVVEKDALFQLLVQSFAEIVCRLNCNVILITVCKSLSVSNLLGKGISL